MNFQIIIEDKKEIVDFKNFNLVSSNPPEKKSITLNDSPVLRKVIEYINKKIAANKPDAFKNHVNPIGEMSFQQKLVLTDILDDYDIKFFEELKAIDIGVFRDSSVIAMKLNMNCLNNKIIYYISHFYVYDEKTKQTMIENVAQMVTKDYKEVKNKENIEKDVKKALTSLSDEFVIKAVQTEVKDSKEELDSLKTKLAQVGILSQLPN